MNNSLPKVRLGEVVSLRKDFVRIDDISTYKRCRVQLHAKGILLRDLVTGSELKTKEQQVCRSGDFLVAEIDAKVGGYGIVPDELEGAIVSSHYFLFEVDRTRLDRNFLGYFIRTPDFFDQVSARGTTNYAAIRPSHVLEYQIPLPPLAEQRRIVAKIDELAARIKEANKFKNEINSASRQLLRSAFAKITTNAKLVPMSEIAPITRRPENIDLFYEYPELGIRSFGNGTFHKPPLSGSAVGSKKLFRIEPGDLVFNNVFAWEGAVAVAKPEDFGRFGSHRFITCLPQKGLTTPDFLCFYFLTSEGLEKLGGASPGGAGRNRTLGLDALSKIEVPVPPIDRQIWFDSLQEKVESLKRHQQQTSTELESLLPSILDKTFKRDLYVNRGRS
jgi:type I restriction enzyme S subunit